MVAPSDGVTWASRWPREASRLSRALCVPAWAAGTAVVPGPPLQSAAGDALSGYPSRALKCRGHDICDAGSVGCLGFIVKIRGPRCPSSLGTENPLRSAKGNPVLMRWAGCQAGAFAGHRSGDVTLTLRCPRVEGAVFIYVPAHNGASLPSQRALGHP